MTHDEIRELARALAAEMNRSPFAVKTSPTLTVEQFAAECGRGPHWVYRQIRRRRITPCRIGKPYQIPRSELQKLKVA